MKEVDIQKSKIKGRSKGVKEHQRNMLHKGENAADYICGRDDKRRQT